MQSDTSVARLLVNRDQLCRMLGISDRTRARRESDDPDFPAKLQLAPQRTAYRLADVHAYIEAKYQAALVRRIG